MAAFVVKHHHLVMWFELSETGGMWLVQQFDRPPTDRKSSFCPKDAGGIADT
jgi:hypothetical protein